MKRYSLKELEEISNNKDKLKKYYWWVGMNAKREACRMRGTNKDELLPNGIRRSTHLERFSDSILDNLDRFVEDSFAWCQKVNKNGQQS